MVIKKFFKRFKKKDDILDLTKTNVKKTSNAVNLTAQNTEEIDLTQASDNRTESDDKGPDALGFLGNLASGSSSTAETPTSKTGHSYYANLSGSYNKARKIKDVLKEIKDKVDNTYDKLYKLSNRIDVIERKIERLERRAGL
jgi:hypothetical protein